jgi:hypothetical protein
MCNFLNFKGENYVKSDPRALRINYVDAYGEPVFAPDYSTTGLAAKM